MRPDPILRIDTAFFWEACERGEFVAQKFNCAREGKPAILYGTRPARCAPNAIPLKKKSKSYPALEQLSVGALRSDHRLLVLKSHL